MDDEEEQHRDGRLSAIARHQVHDQAVSRSIAAAMRNVAARIESIERAVALQAGEIERIDRVLVEIMRQRPGAPDQQIDRPAMQPALEQAISGAG